MYIYEIQRMCHIKYISKFINFSLGIYIEMTICVYTWIHIYIPKEK